MDDKDKEILLLLLKYYWETHGARSIQQAELLNKFAQKYFGKTEESEKK